MPGQDDLWAWLQGLQQNPGAGISKLNGAMPSVVGNVGAVQPYGAGGTPNYGTGPGALGMGDSRGLTAPTPGQPSMGYPAMGPLGASAAPQPAPDSLGSSVGINPHGDGPPDVTSPEEMYNRLPHPQGGPYVGGQGVAPGIGAYPDSTNYPHTLTPPGSPSATPRPADSNAKGPLASSDAPAATPMKRRAGAPNLGYFQPNNRFVQVDRPNASAAGGFARGGSPQMTALNLAGLFNRGQPAANPNVPAANAQPVSMTGGPTPVGQGLNPSGNLALAGGNSPGPNQFSSVPVPYPPNMPGDIRNQRVANAVRNPNWWQNL